MAGSIAFIDESGDLGRRPGKGSSAAFVLAMVVFADKAEAERCRLRIDALRAELGRKPGSEFHFHGEMYFATYFIKTQRSVIDANELYSRSCARLITEAQESLAGATIAVDGSGDRKSRRAFATMIRQQFSRTGRGVKVKVQGSETDNLLQLADYVAGIVRKTAEGQESVAEYHRMLEARRRGESRI